MDNLHANLLPELLAAVGQHLQEAGETAAILVVGGSALMARGWVDRTTQDVDVIARAHPEGSAWRLVPAEPLPPAIEDAVARVARDYGLPSDWLNTVVGAQWRDGLPPRAAEEAEWRTYGGLTVGFAGRRTILALKLFAAVDRGPQSVHLQDLLRLAPSDAELEAAAQWVRRQDASPHFTSFIEHVVNHVRERLGRSGTRG